MYHNAVQSAIGNQLLLTIKISEIPRVEKSNNCGSSEISDNANFGKIAENISHQVSPLVT